MPVPTYEPEHYNEHLVLKVPLVLWLVLLFQVRHLLLLGITFLPTTGQEITVLRQLVQPAYLIADLIALPLLVTAARRRPQAPDWMRRLWPRGRWLLTLSGLAYLGVLGWSLTYGGVHAGLQRGLLAGGRTAGAVDEAVLTSTLLTLAAIAYLWRSPRVRDLFREFPPRH
ncbi:DUF2919 domain-containing protein [Thiohalocapsa marina]|uniref:DUF2919 domain-containing protein n=1 Tax=Thiohalocapsa marina TaxID=424902 RepID=A0A5M8FM48_9GAMM|nr:DUF2919 family protein [Thiohalocapsa marina]KAA6185849.1 DUF2919 domain-containing protein [Thiohalocapsa marina]